jgi:hypothetical protein
MTKGVAATFLSEQEGTPYLIEGGMTRNIVVRLHLVMNSGAAVSSCTYRIELFLPTSARISEQPPSPISGKP